MAFRITKEDMYCDADVNMVKCFKEIVVHEDFREAFAFYDSQVKKAKLPVSMVIPSGGSLTSTVWITYDGNTLDSQMFRFDD